MNTRYTAILVCLLFCCIFSVSSEVKISLLSSKKKEIDGGNTSNFLLSIKNNTIYTQEFKIKIILPKDWQQLMEYPKIKMEQNSSVTKIISIFTPQNAVAGDYVVKITTEDGFQNADTCFIPVYVKPKYEIEIEKLKTVKYLFSGDTSRMTFRVHNLSNLNVKINTLTSNGFENLPGEFLVNKDSTVDISTKVLTTKGLLTFSQQNVSIGAYIYEHPETTTYSNYLYNVIPSKTEKFDGFNRYPITISSVWAYSNRLTTGNFAWLYDIRGTGMIHAEKERKLDFRFRGPDLRGNPLLGLNDEYSMNYKSKHLEINAGDNNYKVTDLVESSRYGRGLKILLKNKKFNIGAFASAPRFFPSVKYTATLSSEFQFTENTSISGSYFTKIDAQNIRRELYSFSGKLQLFPRFKTIFEIAAGLKDNEWTKAYKGQVLFTHPRFNIQGIMLKADKNFTGYISNSLLINSGMNIHLHRKLSLGVNYDQNASNMELDTLYANAPISTNKVVTLNFRPSTMTGLSISANQSSFEDKSTKKIFNYQKDFARLRTNLQIKDFSLNLQGEYGQITNFLRSPATVSDYYTALMQARQILFNKLIISGSINYLGGKEYKTTGNNRFYYGGSVFYNAGKRFNLSVDYQSDFELVEYFRDRSLLSAQVFVEIIKNHIIQFGCNYNLMKNTLDKKEIGLQLRYNYTLNVPVSRKKDIGSLSGQIHASDFEKAEGILLNMGGDMTMTDKEGRFKFPVVQKGTYDLILDESNFAVNTITDRPGPYVMEILPGRETHFELGLTKAAILQGKFNIIEDSNNDTRKVYLLKEKINRLVLEMSTEKEMFRIYSNPDGSYQFSDLRPGKWKFRIYKNGLPQGYSLEKEYFDVELEAGKTSELEIKIFKKNRTIRFQKP